MYKIVNVKANVPVRNVKPPIYGVMSNVRMSTGDILKCLCRRAIVEEVLPDGSVIRLDLKNYYVDNTPVASPKSAIIPDPEPAPVEVEEPEPAAEIPVEESEVIDSELAGATEVVETPVEDPVLLTANTLEVNNVFDAALQLDGSDPDTTSITTATSTIDDEVVAITLDTSDVAPVDVVTLNSTDAQSVDSVESATTTDSTSTTSTKTTSTKNKSKKKNS